MKNLARKQVREGDSLNVSINTSSIDHLIHFLQENMDMGYTNFNITSSLHDQDINAHFYKVRPETDEEMSSRITREEQDEEDMRRNRIRVKQHQEKLQFEEYLRLKEIYEHKLV